LILSYSQNGRHHLFRPALFLTLLILGFTVGCSSGGNDDEQSNGQPTPAGLLLNIGVVQSSTGAAAIYGKTTIQGLELAIKHLESSEVRIQYSVVDDKSTAEGGKDAFTSLTARQVDAIIGPTLSGVALEAMKISQQAGIPSIGATTTGDGITAIGDQVFRTALAESAVVPPVLAYVNSKAPLKQAVLILDSTDAFSSSSAAAMRKGMQAINGTIVLEVDVSKQPDVVAAVQGAQVDGFLVTPLINQSGPIVKSLRDAGFNQTIIGGNSFNTLDIVTASGGAVNGGYVGASWNPGVDNAASKKFVDDYLKAYGTAPDLYAAQGYAAVQVLVGAAKKAGSSDPAALRTALVSARDVETIFGKISMSSTREAEYTPVVQQFQEGKLIVVR
jgi:branched-chain amino acid transport system substrate-binding protein